MRIALALFSSALALQFVHPTGAPGAEATRTLSAIACTACVREKVPLRSTDRLPEASGAATLDRKNGKTEIEVHLDSMRPASLFGGDYNTYVLWAVPSEGRAENLGEIPLEGARARLHAATPAAIFAILVTAEPHYLVSAPSAFVVLENQPQPRGRRIELALIEGEYNFVRSTLDDVTDAKGRVHTEVKQAYTAVQLAQRAGAPTLASAEFALAQRALAGTLEVWRQQKDRAEITAEARKTVRLAVAAQRLARDRALPSPSMPSSHSAPFGAGPSF